jgi:glutamine synthetase
MSIKNVVNLIKKHGVKFVDYRFTDTLGKWHHVTVPANNAVKSGDIGSKAFDGSSIEGWRGIEDSDMLMKPDFSTALIDPFIDEPTLMIICDILLPDGSPYPLCPRTISRNTITHLKKTGIGTDAFFGPEPEFFVFDSVRWENSMQESFYQIDSEEGSWASADDQDGFNSGHRPGIKGGYFPVAPVDTLVDLRNEMCLKMAEVGIEAEVHHHEVATAGQCEIGTRFGTCVQRADQNQLLKYVVRNVAHQFGKTATFMPKPLMGDNGNGMHVHQSIVKNGRNLFIGKKYGGLSQEALWYIGGIMKHTRALNAITNPSTNSYKRLLPGFEAPVNIAYSARNRSAAIRIPLSGDKQRRIETRFPDPMANPYLCLSALLLAGLDGIKNKIDPGDPADYNLYARRRRRDRNMGVKEVCGSLPEALNALDSGRGFLTQSGVFTDEAIDAYLALKWGEVKNFREQPCPVEFQMYYSL